MDPSIPFPVTAAGTDAEPEPLVAPGFDELCRSLSPRLVGSLTLLTGDRSRAEDVAQDALARAWMCGAPSPSSPSA